MTYLGIDLTITTESALSIGAGGSAGTIADKSIVRDGWGRPLIPGSQVKGKLRWAVEQLLRGMGDTVPSPFEEPPDIPRMMREHTPLKRGDLVHALFGSATWRSPLRFADLPTTIVAPDQVRSMQHLLSQIRPSVSINRRRGTAEDQRLLFQETTLERMQFAHPQAITGDLPDASARQCAALLWAALRLTDRWGGAKSRGLGWATVQVSVYLDHANEPVDEPALAAALRVALTAQGGSQ